MNTLKTNLYTIFDDKTKAHTNPFVAPTDEAAIRSVSREVNNVNGQSDLFNYADDSNLYFVGVFDCNTGQICADNAPRFVVSASSLRKPKTEVA